ncbi:GntR family transcriptional regulator [Aquabacter sp. CN5-332]|uniref:GntR family transcriptional regulator n=1 Tax=Aquabacter sp. CN5-332 TaxID=3156608 RepID=UPI0032B5B8BB
MSKLLKSYDRSRIPLYIQVASVMRQRIQSGQWAPGQRISTLEELEREFQVARVTVRQAIGVLQDDGLLHAQQGRGTYVSDLTPSRHWFKLETTWDELIESIRDNVPQHISLEENVAAPALQANDGKAADAYVLLRSVQYRDNEPYSLVNLHLARYIFDLNPKLFMRAPALSTIAGLSQVKVAYAHQTLVIGSADPETADRMMVAIGAPTAECHCVVIDDTGTAIYVADIIYRSDCIKLQIDLLGNAPTPAARMAPTEKAPKRPKAKQA